MEEQRQRTGLFGCLKQVLKSQGIRYKDLAGMMNTSEPTIKRLFAEQDCKLSRLMEVCEAVGISFTELVDLASKQPITPTTLPESTEQSLAERPGLMAFLMLLVSEFDLESIARQNQLSSQDVYLYLRELEKLELIRLRQDNSYYFLVTLPIKWRLDGPLLPTLVRVNQNFITEAISEKKGGASPNSGPFYSASRLLSPNSIKKLNREFDNVYDAFQKQASLDQMFYPADELVPFKMVATMKRFDVVKYFKVPGFDK